MVKENGRFASTGSGRTQKKSAKIRPNPRYPRCHFFGLETCGAWGENGRFHPIFHTDTDKHGGRNGRFIHVRPYLCGEENGRFPSPTPSSVVGWVLKKNGRFHPIFHTDTDKHGWKKRPFCPCLSASHRSVGEKRPLRYVMVRGMGASNWKNE